MVDSKEPTIEVISTPLLACDIEISDLLDYVSVNDEHLKTFFIEEDDLLEILNKDEVTYVAIDESNNISKIKVDVDSSEELKIFHIEEAKPLKINTNKNINIDEYFLLANECGWKKNSEFNISGVDFNTNGEYSAIVSSKKEKCDDINTLFVVEKKGAPTIHLVHPVHYAGANENFTEYYFDNLVDDIYDDNDDIKYANIDWKDVLVKNNDGYYNEGTYIVTYDVQDSDNNIGKSTLMLVIDKEYNIEEPIVEIEENIEEETVNQAPTS